MTARVPEPVASLLDVLRDHGVRVDLVVIGRLGVLLTQLPDDEEMAARMIASAVATDSKDRDASRQAARAWLTTRREVETPDEEPEVEHARAAAALRYATPAQALRATIRERRTWLRRLGLGLVVVAGIVALVVVLPQLAPDETFEAIQLPEDAQEIVPVEPTATRLVEEPVFTPLEAVVESTGPQAIVLFVAATVGLLVSGLWLLWTARRRDGELGFPEPPHASVRGGRGADGPLFLEVEQQDEIVWAATQHAMEVGTRRVDAPSTVRATADKAGIPELRYHTRRHPLGIWVWRDNVARPPEVGRLADEIVLTLAEAGVDVQLAEFFDVPDELVADRSALRPEDADEGLRSSKVVILTDGVGWVERLRGPTRPAAMRLVAELATWRHVRVVCFDAEAHGALEAELQPFGLVVLPPERTPEALGAGAVLQRGGQLQDLDRWGAVLALHPGPVTLGQALEIRHRLGLRVGALDWRALRPQGRGQTIRYDVGERIERLDWFRRTTGYARWPDGERASLERALEVWDQLLEGEGAREQVTRMLLSVWREPADAAWELRSACAADESQRSRVEAELGRMVPADRADAVLGHALVLPWRTDEVDPQALAWLRELGLESALREASTQLRPPGRRVLAMAGLAGIALVSALWWGVGGATAEDWEVVDELPRRASYRCIETKFGGAVGTVRCTAAGPDGFATVEPLSGERFEVALDVFEAPCIEGRSPNRVWRCSSRNERPEVFEERPLSYAVLAGGDAEGRETVARSLLDWGSAVQVVETPELVPFVVPEGVQLLQAEVVGPNAPPNRFAYRVTSWSELALELDRLAVEREIGALSSVREPIDENDGFWVQPGPQPPDLGTLGTLSTASTESTSTGAKEERPQTVEVSIPQGATGLFGDEVLEGRTTVAWSQSPRRLLLSIPLNRNQQLELDCGLVTAKRSISWVGKDAISLDGSTAQDCEERREGVVRVTVRDEAGNPVSDAIAGFTGRQGQVPPQNVGDDGRLEVVLEPGEWSLVVVSETLQAEERRFEVIEGSLDPIELVYTLERQPAGQLGISGEEETTGGADVGSSSSIQTGDEQKPVPRGWRGLARQSLPSGFVIGFPVAPGRVAPDDGGYARALAKQLLAPGDLDLQFARVRDAVTSAGGSPPWVATSARQRFCTVDCGTGEPGLEGRRVALVIGNARYGRLPPLQQPREDANLIAQTLEKLDFEVTLQTDTSRREMVYALRSFEDRLKGAAVGFFYYAGHGVAVAGENYLVPVDADVHTERELRVEGVRLDEVIVTMDRSSSDLNVVVVDACQTSSFLETDR